MALGSGARQLRRFIRRRCGLLADYAAGAHQGFLIRDAQEGGPGAEQAFRPRGGGGNRPQLVITYAPAP